jgi:hypothetical protein
MHFAEDAGYGEGMCNIWLATAPELAIMGLFGVVVSAADEINLLAFQVS